jgi:hypothetical protein
MKKVLSIVLALTMILALASCTGGNTTTSSTEDVSSVETPVSSEDTATVGGDKALEVLNNIWAAYPEDQKFMAGGGDEANMNMEGPGKYGLTDTEALKALFAFPAESVSKVNGAASLMSMMMQNQFTSAAFQLVNAADAETLATELTTSLKATQWICGTPEKIMVVGVGDVVVSAYGFVDFMTAFEGALKTAYPDAVIYTNEALEVQ